MACVHLRRLYQLCQDENLRLSGSDLIHIVCQQCGVQEVCPSAFVEELDVEAEPGDEQSKPDVPRDSSSAAQTTAARSAAGTKDDSQ